MTRFGDDFDRNVFVAAYESPDPSTINAITAVEGDLGHIVNWLKQIAELGCHELVRLERIPKGVGGPLDGLLEAGILTAADRDDLAELVKLRNRMQHDYPGVTPKQIHAAVLRVLELLPGLIERYGRMLERIDGRAAEGAAVQAAAQARR
jgi:hypothetical protein